MKRLFAVVLTLPLLSGCFSDSEELLVGDGGGSAPSAAVGAMAPDFTLPDAVGGKVSLSDYKGKHVVLEWHNKDCPYVVKHYGSGNMQRLQKKYTGKDVVWLSIISSAPGKQGYVKGAQAVKDMKRANAHPTKVLLDPAGDVGRLYRAKTTPHMYVVSPKGELIYDGAIDSIRSTDPSDIPNAKNYVAMALDAAIAGKPVPESQTKPYGCSVKY